MKISYQIALETFLVRWEVIIPQRDIEELLKIKELGGAIIRANL